MIDAPDRGTITLLVELLHKASGLAAVEGQLFRAEMREAGKKAVAGFIIVGVAVILVVAGLGSLTAALIFLLVRFHVPTDAACGIVALVTLVVAALLGFAAGKKLSPSALLPTRTINQFSSTLQGLGK